MDAVLLARIQFAFTIAFHIMFPAFTIGLASWLAMLELLWLRTGKPAYQSLYQFWLKIFAVSFGLGVVSGIVMSFQFGTNWSGFSEAAGNIIGPLHGYEVMTAFFLEATFLGVMLFGAQRVSRGVHFFATCMVALGTLLSAFWILAANSWMQTPAGHRYEDGVFYAESWLEVIFNPSFPYRLAHMVTAAFLSTCFIIAGVAATHLLEGRFPRRAGATLRLAVIFASIVVPIQIVIGDLHGLNTQEHQPVKVAAIEGHWESQTRAPLIFFAVPDQEAERNRLEMAVPGLGSLILHHDLDARVAGLKDFPPNERPPVAWVFYSFRVMVGLGLVMLALAWIALVHLWRGTLERTRWLLRAFRYAAPAGLVALLAGWFTTEVGRQPYLIYGLLRTAEGVSPVPSASVGTTLALFVLVYGVVFGAGAYYVMKLIRHGPLEAEPARPDTPTVRRPLSVPGDSIEEPG
ncbi:MAG TPA: cytochrome ubiquinol oxidase subunit I [Gammaproteobacteria bacterium]